MPVPDFFIGFCIGGLIGWGLPKLMDRFIVEDEPNKEIMKQAILDTPKRSFFKRKPKLPSPAPQPEPLKSQIPVKHSTYEEEDEYSSMGTETNEIF